jgi:hypothetical protein
MIPHTPPAVCVNHCLLNVVLQENMTFPYDENFQIKFLTISPDREVCGSLIRVIAYGARRHAATFTFK